MNYTLVDIGIATSYDFFFEIAWPNYVQFVREPSVLTAVNASWPLWHVRDWYFWEQQAALPEKNMKEFTKRIVNECPELGWLSDIAETGKHRALNRQPVKVRAMSSQEYGGGIGTAPISSTAIGETVTELLIEVGGATHNLHGVMLPVLTYWLGKLLPHHVEARLAPDSLPQRAESMLDWCRERLGAESVRKQRWALIQGAEAPHFLQRFAFYRGSDAADFMGDFPEARPSP